MSPGSEPRFPEKISITPLETKESLHLPPLTDDNMISLQGGSTKPSPEPERSKSIDEEMAEIFGDTDYTSSKGSTPETVVSQDSQTTLESDQEDDDIKKQLFALLGNSMNEPEAHENESFPEEHCSSGADLTIPKTESVEPLMGMSLDFDFKNIGIDMDLPAEYHDILISMNQRDSVPEETMEASSAEELKAETVAAPAGILSPPQSRSVTLSPVAEPHQTVTCKPAASAPIPEQVKLLTPKANSPASKPLATPNTHNTDNIKDNKKPTDKDISNPSTAANPTSESPNHSSILDDLDLDSLFRETELDSSADEEPKSPLRKTKQASPAHSPQLPPFELPPSIASKPSSPSPLIVEPTSASSPKQDDDLPQVLMVRPTPAPAAPKTQKEALKRKRPADRSQNLPPKKKQDPKSGSIALPPSSASSSSFNIASSVFSSSLYLNPLSTRSIVQPPPSASVSNTSQPITKPGIKHHPAPIPTTAKTGPQNVRPQKYPSAYYTTYPNINNTPDNAGPTSATPGGSTMKPLQSSRIGLGHFPAAQVSAAATVAAMGPLAKDSPLSKCPIPTPASELGRELLGVNGNPIKADLLLPGDVCEFPKSKSVSAESGTPNMATIHKLKSQMISAHTLLTTYTALKKSSAQMATQLDQSTHYRVLLAEENSRLRSTISIMSKEKDQLKKALQKLHRDTNGLQKNEALLREINDKNIEIARLRRKCNEF